ncbi:MAG: FGGY family carbohydrate kinase [Myxococcota bacterium]
MTETTAPTEVVLGIDCSTTGCKAAVFDREGRCLFIGRAAYELHNPEPDGWEQNPEDWWRALAVACRAAVEGAGTVRVCALAITHQRETFVVADEDVRPLGPAWVWMDKRCAPELDRATFDRDAFAAATGKPVCTTPSLFKLLGWRKRHGTTGRRPLVVDVHAWLVQGLIGRWVTSTASADPTGMVRLADEQWAKDQVAAVLGGWPRVNYDIELVRPGTVVGTLAEDAAEHLGLEPGVTVVAGAGDGQCAGLGAGVLGEGVAYLNLGTAVVAGTATGEPITDDAFRTLFAARPDGGFILETDLQGGTFTLSWLFETLLGHTPGEIPARRRALEEAASPLPPGSEGLFVVPYWNGVMNPYWDDAASGTIVGLRGHHGPAHFYRAILEGIAFEQKLHFEGVEKALGRALADVVVIGGGGRSDLWCQILADVLERPMTRLAVEEATARGAAMLAAVGHGWFSRVTEVAARWQTVEPQTFTPTEEGAAAYRSMQARYRAIYPSLQLPQP